MAHLVVQNVGVKSLSDQHCVYWFQPVFMWCGQIGLFLYGCPKCCCPRFVVVPNFWTSNNFSRMFGLSTCGCFTLTKCLVIHAMLLLYYVFKLVPPKLSFQMRIQFQKPDDCVLSCTSSAEKRDSNCWMIKHLIQKTTSETDFQNLRLVAKLDFAILFDTRWMPSNANSSQLTKQRNCRSAFSA